MTFRERFRRWEIEPWSWWIARHDLKFFLACALLVILF